MNNLAIEIVEKIIAALPDDKLFTAYNTCWVWYIVVRHEAYKRWRQHANKIKDLYQQYQANIDQFEIDRINWVAYGNCKKKTIMQIEDSTKKQRHIMISMIERGMIVDPYEREYIRHILLERQWGTDVLSLWGFEWI